MTSALILCDQDGNEIAELEVAHTIRFEVSRAWSCTFTLGYDQLGASDLISMIKNQTPQIQAYRYNNLIFSGFWCPQQEVVDETDQAGIQSEFRTPFSRLETRFLTANTNYTNWAIGDLVWDLIKGTNADGYTGIGKGNIQTLPQKTMKYQAGQSIAQAITDLTDANLFQFTESPLPPNRDPLSAFNVWKPWVDPLTPDSGSQGRNLIGSNVRFEFGAGTIGNVVHVERTLGNPINRVIATGYDSGSGPLVSVVDDVTSQNTWGMYQATDSFSNIHDQGTLDNKAAGMLVPQPVQQLTIEIDVGGIIQPFDDYWINDLITLHARHMAFSADVTSQITAIEIDREGTGKR